MTDETTSHAHWQPTVEYTVDIDPARARAIEDARDRLALPKPDRTVVWRLPAPGAAKLPAPTGPYCVVSRGRALAERSTLRAAAKVALSLKDATVQRGRATWGREELQRLPERRRSRDGRS